MNMTSRERFLTALQLKEPDRVPVFDFLMCKGIFRETLGTEEVKNIATENFAASLVLGLDSVYLPLNPASTYKIKFIKENVYVDEWGGIMKIDPVSWPINAPYEFVIKDKNDLKNLKVPDPVDPARFEEMRKVVEINKSRIALSGAMEGPMTRAWYLMGANRILWNIYDNPMLLKDTFKVMNEYAVPNALEQVKTGLDYMWIAEDLGFSAGPFFSLEQYREFVHPFLKQLVDEVRRVRKDLPIAFHCCGNFKIFIEDMIDLGIQAINPFQRTATWDLKEVKKKYGDRICIIGNIDSSRTLPYGTPEDVDKEVKEAINIAGPGGGLVISSDHSLHDGIPIENMWAMINAVKKYGKYPMNNTHYK